MKKRYLGIASIFAISLCSGLVFSFNNNKEVKTVHALDSVEYLAFNETTKEYEVKSIDTYTVLDSTVLASPLASGNYVVTTGTELVVNSITLDFSDDCTVNIIIQDNAKFEIQQKITTNATAVSDKVYALNFFGCPAEDKQGELVLGSNPDASSPQTFYMIDRTPEKVDVSFQKLSYAQYFYSGSDDYMFYGKHIGFYGTTVTLAPSNTGTSRCWGIYHISSIDMYDSSFTAADNAVYYVDRVFFSSGSFNINNTTMNLTGSQKCIYSQGLLRVINSNLLISTRYRSSEDWGIFANSIVTEGSTINITSTKVSLYLTVSGEFTSSTINLIADSGNGLLLQTGETGERKFVFNSGKMTVKCNKVAMSIQNVNFVMNGGEIEVTSSFFNTTGITHPAAMALWDGTDMVINGGKITCNTNMADGLYLDRSFVINGGELNTHSDTADSNYCSFKAKLNSYMTFNGGTVNVYNTNGKGLDCDSNLYFAGGQLNVYSKDIAIKANRIVTSDNATDGGMYAESSNADALSIGNSVAIYGTYVFQYKVNVSDEDYLDYEKSIINTSVFSDHKVARIIVEQYVFDHFDWASDYSSATAVYVLPSDPTKTITKDATVTVTHTTLPTCEGTGVDTFTATEGSNSDTKTVTVPALGHDYQFSSFEWAEDYTCKAVLVCSRDSTHIKKVIATVTSEITVKPTEKETGIRLYTATYETHSETKEEILPVVVKQKGIPAGGVVAIVIAAVAAAAVGGYFIIFFAVNKWILEGDKAIRVFRFGKKNEQARAISHKGKVYYRDRKDIYKTKKDALDSRQNK